MVRVRRTHRPRGGLAVVEFALVLPFLLILLLGIWEAGRLIGVSQLLTNAAREGARQAASGLKTTSQITTAVQFYLKQAMKGQGMSDSDASKVAGDAVITVQNLTNPGTDPTAASQLDQLQVSVSIPFNDVHWVALNLITNSSTKLNGQATWYSVKDQTYPTTETAPAGY
jgi:Flp pilus assembly protein TadG